MKKLMVVFLVVLFALIATVVSAGKADKSKSEEEKAGTSADASAVKTAAPAHLKIAFLPFEVEGARDGTKTMLPDLYKSIFETAGFDVTMGMPVEQIVQKLNIRSTGTPTAKELLDIGQELNVDYVLFAQHKFSTKRVWVTLLPRARSELTLNPMIVNV